MFGEIVHYHQKLDQLRSRQANENLAALRVLVRALPREDLRSPEFLAVRSSIEQEFLKLATRQDPTLRPALWQLALGVPCGTARAPISLDLLQSLLVGSTLGELAQMDPVDTNQWGGLLSDTRVDWPLLAQVLALELPLPTAAPHWGEVLALRAHPALFSQFLAERGPALQQSDPLFLWRLAGYPEALAACPAIAVAGWSWQRSHLGSTPATRLLATPRLSQFEAGFVAARASAELHALDAQVSRPETLARPRM